MWWLRPRTIGIPPLVSGPLLNLLVRAHSIVEVGGLAGIGPERGRQFEKFFYKMCDRQGVHLSEKAGARSVGGQRSASGFAHEVDGAIRGASCTTYWELKHLSTPLEKNELLIFNGKALDFLYDASALFRSTALLRFLLSGRPIRDESRVFSVEWGITVIEPDRLVIPLLYEAVARGFVANLSQTDQEAVIDLAPWACRSLQKVVADLAARCELGMRANPFSAARRAKEILDLQEQIGADILDAIEDRYPDWVNNLANEVWTEIGGF